MARGFDRGVAGFWLERENGADNLVLLASNGFRARPKTSADRAAGRS
jgi:hypothetical protein